MAKEAKSTKFLYEEYKHCFEQLRYYDSLQNEFLKYSITVSTSVLAFIAGVISLFPETEINLSMVLVGICIFLFLSNLLLLLMMTRNRIYYVFCANQLNGIRKYLIENEIPEFKPYNSMYLDRLKGAKLMSTQMLLNFGVAIYASIFLWGAMYFAGCNPICSLVISIISLVIATFVVFEYINSKTAKKADKAINENF